MDQSEATGIAIDGAVKSKSEVIGILADVAARVGADVQEMQVCKLGKDTLLLRGEDEYRLLMRSGRAFYEAMTVNRSDYEFGRLEQLVEGLKEA